MIDEFKAVLFDLDGTLVDSMWMWHAIDIEYLNRFGLTPPDDLSEAIEGMSYDETAVYFKRRFNIEDSLDKIKADWKEMSREMYCTKIQLKAGVRRFLDYLKNKNIKMSICTSNSYTLAEELLKSLDIYKYFDTIVTAGMVGLGKPNPDVYLEAARLLEIPIEKCIVFEDVVQGIMAGKNAGMKTCAVEDEFSRPQRNKKRELADYYINDFNDIINGTYEVL